MTLVTVRIRVCDFIRSRCVHTGRARPGLENRPSYKQATGRDEQVKTGTKLHSNTSVRPKGVAYNESVSQQITMGQYCTCDLLTRN